MHINVHKKLILATATLLLTVHSPAKPFFFCSARTMPVKKSIYYTHPSCCFDKKIIYYDTEIDDDGNEYLVKKYSYKPCSSCCHKKIYKKTYVASAKPRPFFGFNLGLSGRHAEPEVGFSFGLF